MTWLATKKKPTTQASFSRRSNLATAPTKRERKELRHNLISDNNWSPTIKAALGGNLLQSVASSGILVDTLHVTGGATDWV